MWPGVLASAVTWIRPKELGLWAARVVRWREGDFALAIGKIEGLSLARGDGTLRTSFG